MLSHILRTAVAALPVTILALTSCKREPARIEVGSSDTVVVNTRNAARLPAQVFDARGGALPAKGVQYRWVAGDTVRISQDGIVQCARQGDAELRASLGAVSTNIHLLCRPIRAVRLYLDGLLVVGGLPKNIVLTATDEDDKPVTLVAGSAVVQDSSIVSLKGLRVFPKIAGETTVDVQLGDCVASLDIIVETQKDSSNALEPYQQFVVAPLRLVPGEIRSWHIARGVYDITLVGDSTTDARLLLGAIKTNCLTEDAPGVQHYARCIALDGATVVVRHPRRIGAGKPLTGQLVVRRIRDPWNTAPPRPRQFLGPNEMRACDLLGFTRL